MSRQRSATSTAGAKRFIPPGVDNELYARLSYLAIAYMRHERLAESPSALYTLNTMVSDRPRAIRIAPHRRGLGRRPRGPGDPAQRRLPARSSAAVARCLPSLRFAGSIGAYLAAAHVDLEANGAHDWYTVADTGLDHAAILDLRRTLDGPRAGRPRHLEAALAADRAAVQRRLAAADAEQVTADERPRPTTKRTCSTTSCAAGPSRTATTCRGATCSPICGTRTAIVRGSPSAWLGGLPEWISIFESLLDAGREQDDPQLTRLLRSYLPLTFSRRHGDPSRPWNWFTIRVHDGEELVYGYEGNWRDIFQNWEALGISYPRYLPHFISVFLNASTADGYNPYRVTRKGIDWEVDDPEDPWGGIGYWGDHQIVYLLKLLEAYERHEPGALKDGLGDRLYSYADVPYRIGDFESIVADPRHTITFDRARHEALLAAAADIGADGRLVRETDGEVRLVTLAEKLLVPAAGEAHQPRARQRHLAQHPAAGVERRQQCPRRLGAVAGDAECHRALRRLPP